MLSNLHPFERAVRVVLGVLFLLAAVAFFRHPTAQFLAGLAALWSLGEAVLGKCPLYAKLGVRSASGAVKSELVTLLALLAVQVTLAYEWWLAGWEKVTGGMFVVKLDQTLAAFASQNPFAWYKEFLTGFATQNFLTLGYLIVWGQLITGMLLVLGAALYAWAKTEHARRAAIIFSILGLLSGIFMNANFYLAAGWTSPGTHGVNIVMFWSSLALLYVWVSFLRMRMGRR
jgi:hypothetical protein